MNWMRIGTRRAGLAAVLAAVVALVVGAYVHFHGASAGSGEEPPPPLEFRASQLVRPQAQRLAYELSLPGTVQAVSQVTVRSRLSAVLDRVQVREGDAVQAGQVLAEFESSALRAQLAEREANVASARANFEQARRNRQTNEQLVQQSFITQSAFDSADAAYQAQRASVEAAEAQLAQAQLQYDAAVVRAPISGRIARRYVQPGEKVAPDAPLLSIVDLARLEVQAQAAASDVARIQPGAAAELRIEGLSDQKLHGRVERINPSADPGSRTIDLYLSFPNEGERVRAGMFAEVRLQLVSDRETNTLPLTAVQSDAGQSVVWVLQNDHLVRRVVSVGRRDGQAQRAEILGGVGAQDRVLATRFDNLRDGAPARLVGEAGTTGSPR